MFGAFHTNGSISAAYHMLTYCSLILLALPTKLSLLYVAGCLSVYKRSRRGSRQPLKWHVATYVNLYNALL